ncbi:small ubiquitin-related modifier 2-A-like [Senna tora]|uniref:Small ubiquitin-related modifier 2-A-like n=1 Tax=Senna tora TaxID=362788 RepID=A0A834XHJ6_9FABA|nr:small ubiquitin-related modifier 2-A-like [Senna tora]
MYYRMGRNVKLGFLMMDYCDRKGLLIEYVRFTFDGTRVSVDSTPQDLEMEDDDVVDAWTDQDGGGRFLRNKNQEHVTEKFLPSVVASVAAFCDIAYSHSSSWHQIATHGVAQKLPIAREGGRRR